MVGVTRFERATLCSQSGAGIQHRRGLSTDSLNRRRLHSPHLYRASGLPVRSSSTHPPSAEALHFRYCSTTSSSLRVVAPKLSSANGVRGGQLATTRGAGWAAAGERCIDALQLLSRMAAVTVLSTGLDLTLNLLPNGHLAHADSRNGACRRAGCGGAGYLGDALFTCGCGLAGVPAVLSTLPVRPGHRSGHSQRCACSRSKRKAHACEVLAAASPRTSW